MAKKQKSVKLTDAEQILDSLMRELDRCRALHINEPTIQYQVGQRVFYGAIEKSVVDEVLDGGKILRLHENYTVLDYGRSIQAERKTYVAWHEITPWAENGEAELSYRDDCNLQFMNQDVSSLLSKYYFFGVDMEPDYQRGFVWTPEDKVALIDSIFQNVEIGKFVFCYTGHNRPLFEILDGKQRLKALVEFKEGRFAYRGMTYRDLRRGDQGHFDNFHAAVAENRNPMTREQKLRYFLKLNTGGRPQDPAHLAMVRKMWEGEKK